MQLEFALRNESTLERELASLTGLRVRLTITDNTRTVMTVSRDSAADHVRLRLHHMFLSADQHIVNAVAVWIKRPKAKDATALVDAFIRQNKPMMRPRRQRNHAIETQGHFYNLRALFDSVNAEYFGGAITARITWGKFGAGRRRQRSIRFGSYNVEDHLVRIHPLLDQPFVPEYFVRYIVFHEMLHALLGIEESETGRRRIHTPEFQERERAFKDFAKAMAWERNTANLRKLFSSGTTSRLKRAANA